MRARPPYGCGVLPQGLRPGASFSVGLRGARPGTRLHFSAPARMFGSIPEPGPLTSGRSLRLMLMRSPLARDRRRPEGFIPPALLTPATKVPTGPEWLHELKHDGIRLIARKDGDRVRLWSRYGRNRTSDFAMIVAALRTLPADVLIDGEAVAIARTAFRTSTGRYRPRASGRPACWPSTFWRWTARIL